MKPAININCQALTPFIAALSLFTEVGTSKKVLEDEYPVTIDGEVFPSAGKAYSKLSQKLEIDDCFEVLVKILIAKLEQHETLPAAIALSGGIPWLRTCSYTSSIEPVQFWSGTGYESAYITALIAAYRQVNSQLLAERGMNDTEPVEFGSDLLPEPDSDPDGDREMLNKLASYSCVSQTLFVVFNNRSQAKEWGVYLRELGMGSSFTIQDATSPDWKFELVVQSIDEATARELTSLTKFDCRPSLKNPKLALKPKKMPTALG